MKLAISNILWREADDEAALAGRDEHGADHDGQLMAAEGRQQVHRVLGVTVAGLCALQHVEQVDEVVLAHRRAGDDEVAHRLIGQARQDQRRALG